MRQPVMKKMKNKVCSTKNCNKKLRKNPKTVNVIDATDFTVGVWPVCDRCFDSIRANIRQIVQVEKN